MSTVRDPSTSTMTSRAIMATGVNANWLSRPASIAAPRPVNITRITVNCTGIGEPLTRKPRMPEAAVPMAAKTDQPNRPASGPR